MSAPLPDLVSEIVTYVNGQSYSLPVTAVERWFIRDETSAMPSVGEAILNVTGQGFNGSKEDRAAQFNFEAEVVFNLKARASGDAAANLRPYVTLASEILTDLAKQKFSAARSVDVSQPEQVDPVLMDSNALFSSDFTITFRGMF